MRQFLTACALVALFAPAQAAVLTPASAGLNAAIRAARPGDVIQVPAGTAALVISKVVKTGPPVVITGGPALSAVSIVKSEGFTLRGLTIRSGPKGHALEVLDSSRIRVEDTDVAAADKSVQEDARGVNLRGSRNVAIVGSRFHNLRYGIAAQEVSGVLVERNDFRDIYGDAVRGWVNSDNITIRGNTVTDLRMPARGDHLDAFQFWTVNAVRPTTDILVENNTYTRGTGDPGQGVFFGNERLVPFERLTIRGNAIVGGDWNGIWVVSAKDVVIEDNLVQPMAWDKVRHEKQATKNVRTRIVLKLIEGGRVSGNTGRIAPDKANPNVGLDIKANVDPKPAKLDDYTALAAWQKRKTKDRATGRPLAPPAPH